MVYGISMRVKEKQDGSLVLIVEDREGVVHMEPIREPPEDDQASPGSEEAVEGPDVPGSGPERPETD